ncbi:hypothetical protein BDR04DRAFT_1151828 [Suillus decipiens]|nr:hypothetical protein BDR04DRAFT_1151828 [Suillus decipiens]
MSTSSTPATGSNAIPLENPQCENKLPSLNVSKIPSSAFISDSYFLQCTPEAKNHAIIISIKEESPADVNAVTRSKAKANQSTSKVEKEPPHLIEPPPKSPEPAMKKSPAFSYESKAAAPDATRQVYKIILDMTVPHLTVSDLLAISPELQKEAVEHCHMHRVPVPTTSISANTIISTSPPSS